MSHSDNAIENTEQGMKGEKGTRGPRAKFFVCSALLNKKIVMGCVQADDADSAIGSFTKAHEGIDSKSITVEYGQNIFDPSGARIASQDVGGGQGFYLVKGTGVSDSSRISVTVPASLFRPTTTSVKAEYHGWIVYGNGIKGFTANGVTYQDDDLFSILFDERADKNVKTPKPKLKKAEAIRAEDLKVIKRASA
jgi:hypothetical protein